MKNRFIEIITIAVLLVVLAIVSDRMLSADQEEKRIEVSVVVPDSQNDRWKAVREGMKQAADKYGIKIHVVTTGQFISSNDLWSRAIDEKDAGAAAVIINPISAPDDSEEKMTELSGIPLLVFGSDLVLDGTYLSVFNDDTLIGEKLGETLWEDYGDALKTMKIGLVTGAISQNTMVERRAGLESVLKSHGVSIAWSFGLRNTLESALSRQFKNPATETDMVIALGNAETEAVIGAMNSSGKYYPVYGVGYSEKAVHYLDNGTISCLTLTNEFSMGYYSMELLADSMGLTSGVEKGRSFEISCVHTDEIYEEENQAIMFPVVQ